MAYKITVDTGGTFTDVVVADSSSGELRIGKAPTTPRAFGGVEEALEVVSGGLGTTVGGLLAETDLFIYSTTRATNAVLEGATAKTAFLVTAGFPDVLVLREGGKLKTFEFRVPFPEPYVPKRLTFEIPERVGADGAVLTPLDEEATRAILRDLGEAGVEAVAVCLLWSVANDEHELAVGRLIEEVLPGVPYTLSHQINPIVREYRRASSAAIDASLKPLMGRHLREVADDLVGAGFGGDFMVATSFGGVMHVDDLSSRPIFSVRSGPSMAPVAGRTYAEAELGERNVIICDAGGTSFDVSLIREGEISYTKDTWLGPVFTGHLTGSSSVDVRSIGAGGGSIAWVDPGGLLHVGPQSAGAQPGPACYGRGGDRPTVTDAALVLGYLNPERFLGGRMTLDADAAERVLEGLAGELGLAGAAAAADALIAVANEHMVGAVHQITVDEGVDPRESLVIAGGGASGLNIATISKELGCGRILIPRTAGALSAAGAQFSDIVAEFTRSYYANTQDPASFPFEEVNEVLASLDAQIEEFASGLRQRGLSELTTEYSVSARYLYQIWELDLPLSSDRINEVSDLEAMGRDFDQLHERILAVSDPGSPLECLAWKARLTAKIDRIDFEATRSLPAEANGDGGAETRKARFDGEWVETAIYAGGALQPGASFEGPGIVEEETSTIVVPPRCRATVTDHDNYYVEVL